MAFSADELEGLQLQTLALRTGELPTEFGAHSAPIFMTSSFIFANAEQAAKRFAGSEPGCIYSRFTNPTVQAFEARLAVLEGAERAVATASGMGAILALCLAHLQSGDTLLSSRSVFGTTYGLFASQLPKFGIRTQFVTLSDLDAWQHLIKTLSPKLVFVETPSNPLSELVDIRKLADLCHAHGAKLVVDNCLCTPIQQRPLLLGADIIIHSATKFLEGQGRCIGGAVLGSALDMEPVYAFVRTCGPSISPFNAWIILKGLETLNIRMQAQSQTALRLAHWLTQQPVVQQVFYSGLESHPQFLLAQQQQQGGGAVVAFEVKGGRSVAWQLIDAVKCFSITANLGDVRSTITHPATTTHHRLTPEDKLKAGISEGLIRLSVGLEALEDLCADLSQAIGN